jgi:YfiH family protein
MYASHAVSPPFFPDIPRHTLSSLIRQDNPLPYFSFPKLATQKHLFHAVFTREGGVSDGPFESLNVGLAVGDSPVRVRENLASIRTALEAEELIGVRQVHGVDAVVLSKDHPVSGETPPSADALITDVPGKGLVIKLADCQGVVLYDPEKNVVALVHSGWRGNVGNILGKTVRRMEQDFACRSGALYAAIGPSLGPCCGEFQGHEGYFPESFRRFQVRENYFDLWAVSCWQLLEAGVPARNMEVFGVCTRCRADLFYSYRKEGKTGRFAVAAMLKA